MILVDFLLPGSGSVSLKTLVKRLGCATYISMCVSVGFCVGLYRISGWPDIRPFLISGIRPDIRFHLPDIRPDIRLNC